MEEVQVTPVAFKRVVDRLVFRPTMRQENRVPGAQARWKSIRPDLESQPTSTTFQGAGRPSARGKQRQRVHDENLRHL